MTNPRAEAMKEAAQASEEVDVTREAQPSATDLEYLKVVETSLLVSAAPDMLRALKALAHDYALQSLIFHDTGGDYEIWKEKDPEGYAAWENARAAIKKADGGEQ